MINFTWGIGKYNSVTLYSSFIRCKFWMNVNICHKQWSNICVPSVWILKREINVVLVEFAQSLLRWVSLHAIIDLLKSYWRNYSGMFRNWRKWIQIYIMTWRLKNIWHKLLVILPLPLILSVVLSITFRFYPCEKQPKRKSISDSVRWFCTGARLAIATK